VYIQVNVTPAPLSRARHERTAFEFGRAEGKGSVAQFDSGAMHGVVVGETMYVPAGKKTVPPVAGTASIADWIAAVSSVAPSPVAPYCVTSNVPAGAFAVRGRLDCGREHGRRAVRENAGHLAATL